MIVFIALFDNSINNPANRVASTFKSSNLKLLGRGFVLSTESAITSTPLCVFYISSCITRILRIFAFFNFA